MSIISGWQGPAETLFREVHNILMKHVKHLIIQHFAQYPLLQSRITYVPPSRFVSSYLAYKRWTAVY